MSGEGNLKKEESKYVINFFSLSLTYLLGCDCVLMNWETEIIINMVASS